MEQELRFLQRQLLQFGVRITLDIPNSREEMEKEITNLHSLLAPLKQRLMEEIAVSRQEAMDYYRREYELIHCNSSTSCDGGESVDARLEHSSHK